MGIREKLNEKSGLTTTITASILVIAIGLIVWQIVGRHQRVPVGVGYYSDDDGKTWFIESLSNIPPFSHGGKTAVRASVYKCGGKAYVAHLERYTDETKARMEQLISDHPNAPLGLINATGAGGLEVKKPGDSTWVPVSKRDDYSKVVKLSCPEGGVPVAVPIKPENATGS